MNFRGGMRRVAIAAGILGAIAGCFLAWQFGSTVYHNRQDYESFYLLADRPDLKSVLDRVRANGEKNIAFGFPPEMELSKHIENVRLDSDGMLWEIATKDGRFLFRPDSKEPGWEYLLVGLIPIIGFILPWSLVRAITWVFSGFLNNPGT